MNKLSKLARMKSRIVIGLISGTSADGVDAALVLITGAGKGSKIEVKWWCTVPYPADVRDEVLAVSSGAARDAGAISDLNFRLGHVFADAALELCRAAEFKVDEVDLIGSHGQTVFHRPPGSSADLPDLPGSTLQLGEPCVIAERTGVTTVADFRPRDMAAGGQGAPLVPLVDYILFASERKSRCALNLGGIANVTLLPKGRVLSKVLAFDTGPGNMVLDFMAKAFSGGRKTFDEGGSLALKGRPDQSLLERLLSHPYFGLAPPKSTGRETFGSEYAKSLLEQARRLGLSEADTMMTAVTLTARTVLNACREHFRAGLPIGEVVVSGGGVHNIALMEALRKGFEPAPVIISDDLGIPADAKEAIAFAVLANETVCGNPGNVPSATGASRPVILGKVVP